jgi:hypothetical protein
MPSYESNSGFRWGLVLAICFVALLFLAVLCWAVCVALVTFMASIVSLRIGPTEEDAAVLAIFAWVVQLSMRGISYALWPFAFLIQLGRG